MTRRQFFATLGLSCAGLALMNTLPGTAEARNGDGTGSDGNGPRNGRACDGSGPPAAPARRTRTRAGPRTGWRQLPFPEQRRRRLRAV